MKISSIIDYFVKVKLEFSKVVWLKPKELGQLLMTVLLTTILSALFFSIIDAISSSLTMRIIFFNI